MSQGMYIPDVRLFLGKVKHESLGVIFDVLFQSGAVRVIVYSWVNIRY